MDAASIEEINKLRKSMGMKPLPVPGKAAEDAPSAELDEDAPSTIETRQAQAYDNFKKVQDAEAAKKKREARATAVKKAREQAQRFAVLEGKGLADSDEAQDLDAKSWLKNQKKRQKEIAKQRKLEEEQAAAEAAAAKEYTAKDLTGIKVGHDVSSFLDGDEQVLTLKDTNLLDESADEDELENLDLREQEKLNERLELKKKKPIYDPNDMDDTGERGILSHYDEDEGKKKKLFTLDVQGKNSDLADILDAPVVQRRGVQNLDVDMLGMLPRNSYARRLLLKHDTGDGPAPSDYLDPSEIKVKKSKKKKSRTTRQRPADDEDALLPAEQPADQLMDVDVAPVTYTKKRKTVDEDFVDDDDLQSSLAAQRRETLKKRRKTRPEDIARQMREEASAEPETGNGGAAGQPAGMTLDEITGFVDTLVKQEPAEDRRRKTTPKREQATTAMADDADSDADMNDAIVVTDPTAADAADPADPSTTGIEEEESVGGGMASALKLLRGRGILKDQHGAELNSKFRAKELFLAELHRRMAKFDEDARVQRERDRASGRLDRMSVRDREEWQRQQNTIREQHQSRLMDQLYKEGYKPNIELKYTDEHGRSLDQKEAFKHLSHQFHGKGSGKGKTDKMLKRIETEKRREAQSMLDASQNVGMSSAHAQQLKKRREAGVRLA